MLPLMGEKRETLKKNIWKISWPALAQFEYVKRCPSQRSQEEILRGKVQGFLGVGSGVGIGKGYVTPDISLPSVRVAFLYLRTIDCKCLCTPFNL